MIIQKDNIENNLLKAFNRSFLVISVIIALVSTAGFVISHIFDKYRNHFPFSMAKLSSLHLFIVICFVLYISYFIIIKLLAKCDGKMFLIFFTLINLLRFLGCLIFANAIRPVSDFQWAYDIASKSIGFHSILIERSHFPQWCNFICIERLLYSAGVNKYIYFIGIELLLNTVISLLIYKIANSITKNNRVGYIASLLYLTNPSNMLYSMIFFKPDTISLLFVMLAVCLYVRVFDDLHTNNSNKFILYNTLASLSIAIGNAFKPIASIYIIAFSIVCLFLILKLNKKKLLVALLGGIILFMPINKCIGFCTKTITENVLDTSLDKDATWHYLCVGLNTEGEGQIHIGTKSRYYAQMRAKYDYETAVELTKNMLVEDYKTASLSKILLNFAKKFVWIVQDDIMPARYFNGISIDTHRLNRFQNIVYEFIATHDSSVSWLFYIIILCFSLLCVKDMSEYNYGILFCKVSLFGYLCAMMLSEGQSRYKSNIMPFLIILSAIGINKYLSKYKTKQNGGIMGT